jgi:DNA-3-methyladenine glycosylase
MTAAGAGWQVGAGAPPLNDRAWFDRPAVEVAPDLLGMLLIHDSAAGLVAGRIVEVEAYQGPEDMAAHSARGMTPRNAVMFGPAGFLYVYLVYGLHHCANVVCGPGGKPEAVLLRAAQIVEGEVLARQRRGDVPDTRLAAGPGNLGAAFGLDRSANGSDFLAGPIKLAPGAAPTRVARTPRIGVDYAGDWAALPMRFSIADDPYRSRA